MYAKETNLFLLESRMLLFVIHPDILYIKLMFIRIRKKHFFGILPQNSCTIFPVKK